MIGCSTLLLLSALCSAGPEPAVNAPKGHLVIHGGGPWNDVVSHRVLHLAGGPKAKILVVPQASTARNAGPSTAAKWTAAGALDVKILDLKDEQAKESVATADLIWFGGGDQAKLVETLQGTGILEAIRERYRKGAVVGGTSAGAAVMSPVMIVRSAGKPGTPEINQPILADGFGLWPGVIVDQHYLKRRRGERLMRAVRNHPDLLGVGIDESTAVIVSGTSFEVVGPSEVVVIDARKAPSELTFPGTRNEAGADQTSDIRVKTVRLKEGMSYDLDRGVLPQEIAGKR